MFAQLNLSFRSPADSHFGETSPVYTDHVTDVETTPAHKLPGNIQYDSEESDISTICRKKNGSSQSEDLHDSFTTDKERSTEVILDTEVFPKNILNNIFVKMVHKVFEVIFHE